MERRLVLWNPASGQAESAAAVRGKLEKTPGVVLVETKSRDDAYERARRGTDEGFTHVIAAGGDGTVNAIVNGLMSNAHRPTFSILPIGTANDFAMTLAIPSDLERALDGLLHGDQRPMDVIEIKTEGQHRWFANVAAGGNSDEVTRRLTDDMKRTWGPFCYIRGALGVVADLESYGVEVSFDEEPYESHSLWNVIIANGRTNAGHLEVAPRSNPEDGLLDVILIRDGDLIDLTSLAVRFAVADYLASDQVIYRQARSVSIRSQPRLRFSLDGEPISEQPVEFTAIKHALTMSVGPEYVAVPDVVRQG
ncbi:MAG: diacylglycerol kinase family lipid kinase [Planctomycetales bacterium]|nr:diacylglycerol kinase family lipid kinase [Planctomycetales bacterium]